MISNAPSQRWSSICRYEGLDRRRLGEALADRGYDNPVRRVSIEHRRLSARIHRSRRRPRRRLVRARLQVQLARQSPRRLSAGGHLESDAPPPISAPVPALPRGLKPVPSPAACPGTTTTGTSAVPSTCSFAVSTRRSGMDRGVYFDRPSRACIEDLDACFRGRRD